MPSSETDPRPAKNPVEKKVERGKEDDKDVDRDGRERQPNQHTDRKQ